MIILVGNNTHPGRVFSAAAGTNVAVSKVISFKAGFLLD